MRWNRARMEPGGARLDATRDPASTAGLEPARAGQAGRRVAVRHRPARGGADALPEVQGHPRAGRGARRGATRGRRIPPDGRWRGGAARARRVNKLDSSHAASRTPTPLGGGAGPVSVPDPPAMERASLALTARDELPQLIGRLNAAAVGVC